MKKAFQSCFILVLLVLALSGCELFGPESGGNSDLFILSKSTTPWVAGVTGERSAALPGTAKALEEGSPTFGLYQVFRGYSYPADEGIIDTGNIYKLIYEASSILENNKSLTEPITPTQLASSFNFGTGSVEYDHLYNQTEGILENGNTYYKTLAYKEDGTTTQAVFGYTVEEPFGGGTKTQRQIFLTTYDTLSKDLTLDFATFDDKPNSTTDDFGRRFYVEGNADTHVFFCHLATGGQTSVSSIVGKGVSDGTGYYILCLPGSVRADDRYYRLRAGATWEDFDELVEAGSALADLDDPEGYGADIDDYLQTPAYTTRLEIPTSLSDFANEGHVVLPE